VVGAPPSPSQAAEELEVQHNAGLQLLALGDAESAGLMFEAVIEADPNAADSWSALGLCMAELKQEEAAVACQRQVLRIRAADGVAGEPLDGTRSSPVEEADDTGAGAGPLVQS